MYKLKSRDTTGIASSVDGRCNLSDAQSLYSYRLFHLMVLLHDLGFIIRYSSYVG